MYFSGRSDHAMRMLSTVSHGVCERGAGHMTAPCLCFWGWGTLEAVNPYLSLDVATRHPDTTGVSGVRNMYLRTPPWVREKGGEGNEILKSLMAF